MRSTWGEAGHARLRSELERHGGAVQKFIGYARVSRGSGELAAALEGRVTSRR